MVGNSTPRVAIQRRSPRIRKIPLATTEENGEQTVHPINTMVRKQFGNHNHRGTVSRYDYENELYWIDYDNGDSEEMSWKQVHNYKCNDQDYDIIPIFTRDKVRPRRSTAHLAATSVMTSSIPQHLVNAVFDEATKKIMEMRELINHPDPNIRARWIIELANKWGKLLLGVRKGKNRKGNSRVGDGHNTIKFIHKHQVPRNKKVSYPRFCCDTRSQK